MNLIQTKLGYSLKLYKLKSREKMYLCYICLSYILSCCAKEAKQNTSYNRSPHGGHHLSSYKATKELGYPTYVHDIA